MTNPFGATIELLKGCLEDCGINGFGGDQIESMKASLRVLEAAGRIKKDCSTCKNWERDTYHGSWADCKYGTCHGSLVGDYFIDSNLILQDDIDNSCMIYFRENFACPQWAEKP